MSDIIAQLREAQKWRCAGCGEPPPFRCSCPTAYAFQVKGPTKAKTDVTRRFSAAVLALTRKIPMTEPTREDLTAELDALDARKAEVLAQLDKMPSVYRRYWYPITPHALWGTPEIGNVGFILEWTVENGTPRVIGDFKGIGE